jgi:hypothetical protein
MYESYGDVIIAGEGIQTLGLCLAISAFEQEDIFIIRGLGFSGLL